MQFAAQDRYYASTTPGAEFRVVLVDGEPAGRLTWTAGRRSASSTSRCCPRAVAGIGTRCCARFLRGGAGAGRPVTIHVEQDNRARGLYERLGFRQSARPASTS